MVSVLEGVSPNTKKNHFYFVLCFCTMNTDQECVSVAHKIPAGIMGKSLGNEGRFKERSIASHVTVFDYDDTLFPSSWLSQLCAFSNPLPKGVLTELQRVNDTASQLLLEAMSYSSVMVVTNAEEEWVYESSRLFLPSVFALLDKITVISARDQYESLYPNDSAKWKRIVFSKELSQMRPQSNDYFSVLSIGDSLHEREAVLAFGENNLRVIAKSIKMIDLPSPSQLATQQELIAKALPSMIYSQEKLDLQLSVQTSL